MLKKRFGLFSILLAAFLTFLLLSQFIFTDKVQTVVDQSVSNDSITEAAVNYRFGLPVDSFNVVDAVVKSGETFGNILTSNGVNYSIINRIASNFKDIFDVRYIRKGKRYSLFSSPGDSTGTPRYMVYQPNAINYYVFDLSDSAKVYEGKRKITTKTREVSGRINSSLYETLVEKGASAELAVKLANIYAWTVDFFKIQKGDYFKVIYEQNYIDDSISVGVGKIVAAEFNQGGDSYYSFHYENKKDNYSDFFDEKGVSLHKAFLKAPLKFFHISSHYTMHRFHPILKRNKPHLGTDYAAPTGTPIMATASGTVIAASYTSGNGNYVKIRHNATYTTQYLHMSKFAKGMHKGEHVKQGEIIGYVGMTGLATGPHVCYRFWKNGKQVDPYKQKLPDADPIKKEYKDEYMQFMSQFKDKLDSMPLDDQKEEDVYMAAVN